MMWLSITMLLVIVVTMLAICRAGLFAKMTGILVMTPSIPITAGSAFVAMYGGRLGEYLTPQVWLASPLYAIAAVILVDVVADFVTGPRRSIRREAKAEVKRAVEALRNAGK